jgi:hypothetical protein
VRIERHTIDGRFAGMWYNLDDGRVIYLAHRKRREIDKKTNAWLFDTRLLYDAQARNIDAIGVVVGTSKGKFAYLTLLDDLFNSKYSFSHCDRIGRKRGLPVSRFRVNPGTSEEVISSAVKIR